MRTALPMLLAGMALLVGSCKRDPTHGFPVPEASATEPNAPAIPPAVEKCVRQEGRASAARAFGALRSRPGQVARTSERGPKLPQASGARPQARWVGRAPG